MTRYDIVQRLLDAYEDMRTGSRNDLKEAADEIKRLRKELDIYKDLYASEITRGK